MELIYLLCVASIYQIPISNIAQYIDGPLYSFSAFAAIIVGSLLHIYRFHSNVSQWRYDAINDAEEK